ncbi:MAG: beta-eliminating lyase-related protein, partial [Propionibacteriaceae bacterium]|nr:beta-eliminating lyase-related protein [Propionibacteriaceae bacterium]
RKRLGGGWRQAGLLAAGCLYALDHHVERLALDHEAARAFAEGVRAAGVAVTEPETNIVVVPTGGRRAGEVVALASERGVQLSAVGARVVRAVTHLDVTTGQCADAGAVLGEILAA